MNFSCNKTCIPIYESIPDNRNVAIIINYALNTHDIDEACVKKRLSFIKMRVKTLNYFLVFLFSS